MKERLINIIGLNPDFLGLLASMTCAIHCLALPILASVGLMSTGHHHHTVDFVFFGLGIVFAGFSLFKDYRRHGYKLPVILGLVGFTVLYFGITKHFPLLSVAGGLSVAVAHIINFKHTSLACKMD